MGGIRHEFGCGDCRKHEQRIKELEDEVACYEAMKAGVAVRIADLESENTALRQQAHCCQAVCCEVEQTLGKALGYPECYPSASTVDDGTVCVGEHVTSTIAAEAARVIGGLRQRAEAAEAVVEKLRAASVVNDNGYWGCLCCKVKWFHGEFHRHSAACVIAAIEREAAEAAKEVSDG